jgi:hypothetical protein
MSVIRRKVTANFTVLPNDVLNDTRLCADSLGLLVYLLSRPPNWVAKPEQLQQRFDYGRDKIYGLVNRLAEIGYIKKYRNRGDDGVFTSYTYEITDLAEPKSPPLPENPEMVIAPLPENPELAEPDLVNPEISNKELKETKNPPLSPLEQGGLELKGEGKGEIKPEPIVTLPSAELPEPTLEGFLATIPRNYDEAPSRIVEQWDRLTLEDRRNAGIVARQWRDDTTAGRTKFRCRNVSRWLRERAFETRPATTTKLPPAPDLPLPLAQAWAKVSALMRKDITRDVFEAWFGDVWPTAIDLAAGTVTMSIDTAFRKRWIEENMHRRLIHSWQTAHDGSIKSVVLVVRAKVAA